MNILSLFQGRSVDSIMAPVSRTIDKLERHGEKQSAKAEALRSAASKLIAEAKDAESEARRADAQTDRLAKLLTS